MFGISVFFVEVWAVKVITIDHLISVFSDMDKQVSFLKIDQSSSLLILEWLSVLEFSDCLEVWAVKEIILFIFIVVLDWKCWKAIEGKESSFDNYNEYFEVFRSYKFIWTRQVSLFEIPLLSDSIIILQFIWVSAFWLGNL